MGNTYDLYKDVEYLDAENLDARGRVKPKTIYEIDKAGGCGIEDNPTFDAADFVVDNRENIFFIPDEDHQPVVNLHIKVAIFLDYNLTNTFRRKQQHPKLFVSRLFHGISSLFNDNGLPYNFTFHITHYEELHKNELTYPYNEQIDDYHSEFCGLRKLKQRNSNAKTWDISILLSGHQLNHRKYYYNVDGYSHGKVCRGGCCIVIEISKGGLNQPILLAAHEIGHCFNIKHSPPEKCKLDIMAARFSSKSVTWGGYKEECGTGQLLQFVRGLRSSNCMLKDPSVNTVVKYETRKLPGETIRPNEQCSHIDPKYPNFVPFGQCDYIRCRNSTQRYWNKWATPLLEGTFCDLNRWCRHGRCVWTPKWGNPLEENWDRPIWFHRKNNNTNSSKTTFRFASNPPHPFNNQSSRRIEIPVAKTQLSTSNTQQERNNAMKNNINNGNKNNNNQEKTTKLLPITTTLTRMKRTTLKDIRRTRRKTTTMKTTTTTTTTTTTRTTIIRTTTTTAMPTTTTSSGRISPTTSTTAKTTINHKSNLKTRTKLVKYRHRIVSSFHERPTNQQENSVRTKFESNSKPNEGSKSVLGYGPYTKWPGARGRTVDSASRRRVHSVTAHRFTNNTQHSNNILISKKNNKRNLKTPQQKKVTNYIISGSRSKKVSRYGFTQLDKGAQASGTVRDDGNAPGDLLNQSNVLIQRRHGSQKGITYSTNKKPFQNGNSEKSSAPKSTLLSNRGSNKMLNTLNHDQGRLDSGQTRQGRTEPGPDKFGLVPILDRTKATAVKGTISQETKQFFKRSNSVLQNPPTNPIIQVSHNIRQTVAPKLGWQSLNSAELEANMLRYCVETNGHDAVARYFCPTGGVVTSKVIDVISRTKRPPIDLPRPTLRPIYQGNVRLTINEKGVLQKRGVPNDIGNSATFERVISKDTGNIYLEPDLSPTSNAQQQNVDQGSNSNGNSNSGGPYISRVKNTHPKNFIAAYIPNDTASLKEYGKSIPELYNRSGNRSDKSSAESKLLPKPLENNNFTNTLTGSSNLIGKINFDKRTAPLIQFTPMMTFMILMPNTTSIVATASATTTTTSYATTNQPSTIGSTTDSVFKKTWPGTTKQSRFNPKNQRSAKKFTFGYIYETGILMITPAPRRRKFRRKNRRIQKGRSRRKKNGKSKHRAFEVASGTTELRRTHVKT